MPGLPAIPPRSHQVPRGLSTSADVRSDSLVYEEYLNARAGDGTDRRRDGYVRLYRWGATSDLLDLDGSSDFVTLTADSRVWPLGTRFTLELLWQNDTVAASSFVLGSGSAGAVGVKIEHTSSSTVVTTVTDSAAATTTLTHTGIGADNEVRYQLKRDGANLTATINGTAQTGTMNATNSLASTGTWVVGKDNAGSFFNGRVDFLRLLRVLKTHTMDSRVRLGDPRAPSVVLDYIFTADANGYVVDRGPLGLHGVTSGSPATNGAPLAVNPAAVTWLGQNKDNDTDRQAYAVVDGAIVPLTF
jgi:hypothetical protein